MKVILSSKRFLTELFQTSRAQATSISVIAQDPMREVVEAIYRANQQINQQLRRWALNRTSTLRWPCWVC